MIEIIKETVKNHKRIIFNGNNYSDEWVEEAERRGLFNLRSTPEAILRYRDEKNIDLFTRHKIFTKQEVLSRCEILLENYTKVINVEALTMADMAKQEILPAVIAYEKHLAETAGAKKAISAAISCKTEEKLITELSVLADDILKVSEELEEKIAELKAIKDSEKSAFYCKTTIVPTMEALRRSVDKAETYMSKEYLPYPTYADLLFSV